MALTNVTQKYGSTFNLSITEKDGRVTRVTTWRTGATGSTERHVDVPREGFIVR